MYAHFNAVALYGCRCRAQVGAGHFYTHDVFVAQCVGSPGIADSSHHIGVVPLPLVFGQYAAVHGSCVKGNQFAAGYRTRWGLADAYTRGQPRKYADGDARAAVGIGFIAYAGGGDAAEIGIQVTGGGGDIGAGGGAADEAVVLMPFVLRVAAGIAYGGYQGQCSAFAYAVFRAGVYAYIRGGYYVHGYAAVG